MKPKILVVDDEPAVLEAIERVLRQDFAVLTAPGGREALTLLHTETDVAVLLCDYQMPGPNGVEILKQARVITPNAVRCILSGHIDLLQIAQAINRAEIHRLVLKPWDNEVLKIQMLEALQNHRLLTEQQSLRHIAVTDPVTGLTNHRFFQERLAEHFNSSREQNRSLALIMIDVDHFKSYNDRFGHPEGDRLLLAMADQMASFFGSHGTVSRYGGEEFSVLLKDFSGEAALKLAEEFRLKISSTSLAGPMKSPAYVTVSLGVSALSPDQKTASDLLGAADRALYQAKRQGRNRCVLAPSNA